MTAPMVVVGGGLTGSLLAVFLARRGHAVEVFERHPDPQGPVDGKRAALSITLCERGLRALSAIGLRDEVLSVASPAYGRRVHALDGTVAYQPYSPKNEAIYAISRPVLNELLVLAAQDQPNVRFHFNHKCIHVDPGAPTARFEDTASGDVLDVRAERIFGADGAFSAVRGHLQRTDQFNYSQQYLSQGYTSLRVPAQPNGAPILQEGALHIWPRDECMLIGFPNVDASVSFSLLMPFSGRYSYASLDDGPKLLSFFRTLFPDALTLIPGLASQFFGSPRNSLVTIRCNPWSFEDKVVLLGDAAHTILPSYGQGANAALEDCLIFDQCLAKHEPNWQLVFRDFELQRRPHLDAMSELCVRHFIELSSLVGDPVFLERAELERRLYDCHPSLFEPLYPMVSFGTRPYAEAIQRDKMQQQTLDTILSAYGASVDVRRPEIVQMLKRLASGAT